MVSTHPFPLDGDHLLIIFGVKVWHADELCDIERMKPIMFIAKLDIVMVVDYILLR